MEVERGVVRSCKLRVELGVARREGSWEELQVERGVGRSYKLRGEFRRVAS